MEKLEFHSKKESMERILEVRYSNLEEEKSLCLELIAWAKAVQDEYALAFGYTYLGDYYIAQNESAKAGEYLKKAKSILEKLEKDSELMLRLLSFTAICYELQADEQSSIQYYMEAIILAKQLDDKATECLIYNNLAFAYQRHKSHEEALEYFFKAYELLQEAPNASLEPVLLGNLVELLSNMGRTEEALEYIHKCDACLESQPELKEEYAIRNWCCFYGALQNKEEAVWWAEKALQHVETYIENKLSAFENFNVFFKAMMNVGNQKYAKIFLDLLVEVGESGGLDQKWALEVKRMEYDLGFEPKEEHLASYRRFYTETCKLRSRGNLTIINAMKGQINLDNALLQNEALLNEQETLERQVEIDELSQLYTRGYLENLLRARDGGDFVGKSLAIIMIDVDYFKEYNDFYGHLEGDNVLRTLGECMLKNSGEGIFPCRYGGDEFSGIIDNATEEQVEAFIHSVRRDLEERAIPHEKSLCSNLVTLSIGYALEEVGEETRPYYLMQLADQALYMTKFSGRNGFRRKRVGEA